MKEQEQREVELEQEEQVKEGEQEEGEEDGGARPRLLLLPPGAVLRGVCAGGLRGGHRREQPQAGLLLAST